MKKGLHHVALTAADLQKTIDFYTRVFGFTVVRRWGDEKPAAMLDMGDGSLLEIFSGGNSEIDDQGKWLHIAVATEDTDAVYQAALEAGAVSHMVPTDIVIEADNPLPARIAFVRGLNSELIEVFCEK
ncbi:MAG TPA: VOC family protein [Candidatus Faecivivens stercorigallinarum]|nr:VOC family protein [Candidatus Faecivivens stercorigallinarum]